MSSWGPQRHGYGSSFPVIHAGGTPDQAASGLLVLCLPVGGRHGDDRHRSEPPHPRVSTPEASLPPR
jgi:hypothetical protein